MPTSHYNKSHEADKLNGRLAKRVSYANKIAALIATDSYESIRLKNLRLKFYPTCHFQETAAAVFNSFTVSNYLTYSH